MNTLKPFLVGTALTTALLLSATATEPAAATGTDQPLRGESPANFSPAPKPSTTCAGSR